MIEIKLFQRHYQKYVNFFHCLIYLSGANHSTVKRWGGTVKLDAAVIQTSMLTLDILNSTLSVWHFTHNTGVPMFFTAHRRKQNKRKETKTQ